MNNLIKNDTGNNSIPSNLLHQKTQDLQAKHNGIMQSQSTHSTQYQVGNVSQGNDQSNKMSSNQGEGNNLAQSGISVKADSNIPNDLDTKVPEKQELYGTEALLANAGIDKQGHMKIDKDAVLDLNAPTLQVIKTTPEGKKIVMPLEEYTKEQYKLDPNTGSGDNQGKSLPKSTVSVESVPSRSSDQGLATNELKGSSSSLHSNHSNKDSFNQALPTIKTNIKNEKGVVTEAPVVGLDDNPADVPNAQPDKILDPGLAKYKVLIIEDNSDVRYQYEFILKREGFTVITAKDGEEGITKAIKERPQLILLDILMPGLDGWEVLKALRQYTSTYKPRIMIISNLGAPEDIQKAYDLGADMFIIKADTTLQQLVSKVKNILQSSEALSIQPLLIPLPRSSELAVFLKNNIPELAKGICPVCGGPLGLKLIPQKHQDSVTHRVSLDFNARIVCLRCGKEWS